MFLYSQITAIPFLVLEYSQHCHSKYYYQAILLESVITSITGTRSGNENVNCNFLFSVKNLMRNSKMILCDDEEPCWMNVEINLKINIEFNSQRDANQTKIYGCVTLNRTLWELASIVNFSKSQYKCWTGNLYYPSTEPKAF